jgi:hypothetical protein
MTKTDSTINAKRKAKNTSKPTKPKKDDKEKSPNQGASKEQDNKQRPSKMIEKQIKATKTQNKVVGVSQKKNSKTKESKKKSIKKETDSSKEQDNKQRSSKMKVVDASVKKKSKTKGSTIKSSKKETNSRVEQPQPSSKEKAPTTQEERELTQSVVPALLMGAYHLPGYTWRQDLWQYLTNNHPIFGICFVSPSDLSNGGSLYHTSTIAHFLSFPTRFAASSVAPSQSKHETHRIHWLCHVWTRHHQRYLPSFCLYRRRPRPKNRYYQCCQLYDEQSVCQRQCLQSPSYVSLCELGPVIDDYAALAAHLASPILTRRRLVLPLSTALETLHSGRSEACYTAVMTTPFGLSPQP